MRWDRGYRSSDVEDRRGMPAGGGGLFGLVFWMFRLFGWKGGLIALVLAGGWYLWASSSSQQLAEEGGAEGGASDEMKSFVSFVLDDVQNTWTKVYAEDGQTYRRARLVLFTGRVDSACGLASSATGPFYCPSDQRVYIDLAFYGQLRDRLGAPGDFAQAYVIAHEIGHHVQNLQGALRSSQGKGAEGGSVRVELQADCYAGVWAHSTGQRELLEQGDIEEAMRAAEAIGDDALQRSGTGQVRPETFTHGTSEQRMRWFRRGFSSGDPDACNTFGAVEL